ncbi:chemotaxis regulatory protein ChePep [Helicobacter pylori]
MKMILFNQNPMIAKLLESVSKKLELSMENFNHYQELFTRLKEDPEWILIADDECLEKLDQVDWLELKETISQNKNGVCMYKKGNEAQPFLEGFEMKIQKPFLPTEVLKILQKKLSSNASELEPSQNLDPTQEVLETNWDELKNLGDLEALVQEEPNNEEQLLPTLNDQEEKEEVKETLKEEEKPKDDETQENETLKDKEVSKELETQEKLEIPKEETQEEQVKEQEPIKKETQENKEEKQEKTQDSPSAQELEAMQELVKEIQENSNGQENKEETQEKTETPQETPQDVEIPQEKTQEKTQESAETPQEKETQELEIPKEETQEKTETPQEKETQESAEALQETQAHELEKQEIAETPQDVEIPQSQEKETQETQEVVTEKTQVQEKETQETQEDHYESIEDIPEPVMAKAMGEELPFLNEAVAKTPNNENDTETPKESVTETPKESDIKTPQEKEESDKTSSPLELRLNLQDLLKSLNQESLKSLLENKTLSIKITLEDKKPNA